MPKRFEDFEIYTENMEGAGLWGTDPPKALADVVEALIGVAHIDGGHIKGQSSANNVINPMAKEIMKDLAITDKQRRNSITHPKQMMLENCEFLKVKALSSNNFVVNYPSKKIWYKDSWEKCSEKECLAVGEVLWFGNSLCAVADKASMSVAKNRACALVNSTLRKYPKLRSNLIKMSEEVKKQL